MNLLIDIGNSRVHLAADNALDAVRAFYYAQDSLAILLDRYTDHLKPPERVLVANVAGAEVAAEVIATCKARWSVEPEFITATAHACGVTNAYSNPSRLGVDRWLAMIAAWNKFRDNLCIFDCGSALTADLVTKEGRHLGGYIIPGSHMMQNALVSATGQIVLDQPYHYTDQPGRSTDECVYNGTTIAAAAFIEFIMARCNTEATRYRCILSGGGADALTGLLNIQHDLEPLLVIEGLKLTSAGLR